MNGCKDSIIGKGCYKCADLCKKATCPSDKPMFVNDRCSCDVCLCQCTMYYKPNKQVKVATCMQIERDQNNTNVVQRPYSKLSIVKSKYYLFMATAFN